MDVYCEPRSQQKSIFNFGREQVRILLQIRGFVNANLIAYYNFSNVYSDSCWCKRACALVAIHARGTPQSKSQPTQLGFDGATGRSRLEPFKRLSNTMLPTYQPGSGRIELMLRISL